MKKSLFKKVLSIILAAVLSFSAIAVAMPALAAKEAPLHNEQSCYDFSEMNLVTGTSSLVSDVYDRDVADGGQDDTAVSYFASWQGPVNEETDPYNSHEEEIVEHKKLSSVIYMEKAVNIRNSIDSVKRAIMNYGALYCSYSFESEYSDGYTNFYLPLSVYYELPDDKIDNHAVAAIGWDDNYPKENFPIPPSRDGAIICKNSWDTYAGDDGYCYISYDDMIFDQNMSSGFYAYVAEGPDCDYNKIYQYDEFGDTSNVGTLYGDIEYVANVFPEEGRTLESDETLKAVSFYTYTDSTDYTVYIVENYKKTRDLKLNSFNIKAKKAASGTIDEPGYYVVDLDEDYNLKKGTRYGVIVELDNADGSSEYYACESACSKDIKGNKGESFYFAEDIVIDLNDSVENSNWCIKAFTKYVPALPSGSSAQTVNGNVSYFGIDNANRKYESTEYYSFEELLQLGVKINPEYIEYVRNPDGRAIIPSPTVYYHTDPQDTDGTEYPEKFDLRDYGYVSTVKDQGSLGSCWAHASIASFESSALRKYPSADGNGIFNSVKELKTREEQTASIDSAGGEAVYKFTAPISAEYVFSISGSRANGELCTAFGIVVDEIGGSSCKRYMPKGDTVYLRVRFTDSKSTGDIKVKVDTEYLYDESSVTEIKVGESVNAITSADEYQLYRFTNDEHYEGFIKVFCNETLEITLDGEKIFPQEKPEFFRLSVKDGIPSENVLAVKAPSGGTEYEITTVSVGEEYIENAVDIAVGDVFGVEGGDSYRFVPEEDGFYGFCGQAYVDSEVYCFDGNIYEITEDNYKDGYVFFEKGKEYCIVGYPYGDTVQVKFMKWDESPSVEEVSEGETVYGALFSETDTATIVFVAEEDGYYRFTFNENSYEGCEAALTDENGEKCADSVAFNGVYRYDYIKKGETRYFTVEFNKPDYEDFIFNNFDFTLTVEKRPAGSYAEDIPEIKQGEEFTVTADEMADYYKFVPEETGEYVFRIDCDSELEYEYIDALVFDKNFDYVYGERYTPGFNDNEVYKRFHGNLQAGEPYYVSFYAETAESITLEIINLKTLNECLPEVIEPANSYEFVAVGGEDGPIKIPFKVEGTGEDYNAEDIVFTFASSRKDFDNVPYFTSGNYTLKKDNDGLTEKDGVYYHKFIVVETTFEEGVIDFLKDGLDEELNFTGANSFTVEIVESAGFDYLSCMGELSFLGIYTAKAYFEELPEDTKIIWSSSNEKVAMVSEDGIVFAVGIGSAVITAKTEDGSREVDAPVYVRFAQWQIILKLLYSIFAWY